VWHKLNGARGRHASSASCATTPIHTYLPGWEIDVIRGEIFATGYGFIVDYLAEILRHLRGKDRSADYRDLFTLSPTISTRDRDGVQKTFSGLMKLLFPGGGATPKEVEELLSLAMEGRKRVKDQLMQLDSTYPEVDFTFTDTGEREVRVTVLPQSAPPLRPEAGGKVAGSAQRQWLRHITQKKGPDQEKGPNPRQE